MAVIPGLPPELRTVPPAPVSPDDPEADAKRAAWLAWRTAVLRWRVERQPAIDADPNLQAIERAKCAQHPAYWLTAWGYLYEPRTSRLGGGYKPFIPFAAQVELMDTFLWCLEQDDENADLLDSKSRDMAVSWTFCGIAAWGWLFRTPWTVLMVSRKEEYVDSKLWRSLFKKIDCLLKKLPAWMLPAGFEPKLHRQKLMLTNPVNDNQIGGESTTTSAGRGDRVTWMLFDEAAFIPDFLQTWSTAADSTDHRVAVSSESFEEGPDFYRLRVGLDVEITPKIIEQDWWLNPFHDQAWYDKQKARYAAKPDAFAAEILRDPRASLGGTWVYPKAMDIQCDEAIQYKPGASLFVGVDPGFRDETALVWLQDDPATGLVAVLDAYQNKNMPADFYGTILTGEMQSGEWDYDEEDLRIIAFTQTLPRATYYGDVYGNNTLGASLDTWYTRLAKFGIYVNRDRTPEGELTATRRQARSFKGRREALRELLPRLRFAETPGARLCLRALQENRFADSDRATMSEPNKPLHDWTSHLVSALEYVAVNRKLRQQSSLHTLKPATKARLMPGMPTGPRWPTQNRMVS